MGRVMRGLISDIMNDRSTIRVAGPDFLKFKGSVTSESAQSRRQRLKIQGYNSMVRFGSIKVPHHNFLKKRLKRNVTEKLVELPPLLILHQVNLSPEKPMSKREEESKALLKFEIR